MIDLQPTRFYLSQNYPNPFCGQTTIKYCVSQKCRVTVTIYGLDDTVIEKLVDEEKLPGTYKITWNAKDARSGSYVYRMEAGNFVDQKEMAFLKQ